METNFEKLIQAIFAENTTLVSELAADKSLLEERWVLEQTPLCVAVSLGSIETARVLLEAGADIEALNVYGLSQLYIAVVRQDVPMVTFLLEAGASSETPSKTGASPYDISRERTPEITELLAKAHDEYVKAHPKPVEEPKKVVEEPAVKLTLEEIKAMLNVDRVAIAGADETVRPEQLAELSRKYPFVEWSILFDTEFNPLNRFPTIEWIRELTEQSKQLEAETGRPMNLSIHLCRSAVKGLIHGDFATLEPIMDLLPNFQRMQLNVVYKHVNQYLTLIPGFIRQLPCKPQIIIQLNGARENEQVGEMLQMAGIDFVYLHDRSGGKGKETKNWLPPVGSYCGYAGGLAPENLERRLFTLARLTEGHRIYVDLESGVRDENDLFVLDRAEEVLKIAQDWIK